MATTPRIVLIASPLMTRSPALERALGLAKATGASLHIVAFDYLQGLAQSELDHGSALEPLRATYPARHQHWLQEQTREAREQGLDVTTEARWIDRVSPELLDHIGQLHTQAHADWLIKDVHRDPLLARVMFTSQDLHLLHRYPNRLHLVSSAACAVPRQIMVGVDIYPHDDQHPGLNERLIHQAQALGRDCDAQVHLVYAYGLALADPAEWAMNGSTMTASAMLAQELYDAMAESFNALADRAGIDHQHRHMLIGSPGRALLRFAESQGVDVMILGASNRRAPGQWLGSTTEHVMNKMHSSLLVIS